MTPEQTERLVAAMERIATALTTLALREARPEPTAQERFYTALAKVEKVGQAATLWRKAAPTLTGELKTKAWDDLIKRVGEVAKIKNPKEVLQQELAKPAKKGGAP